ncbi:isopentenyl-diphosphate delta-isomerase [Peteryoungia desertarenae]|uniref:Isopentenyl-diphosphate Delta-isomerase n=1 Tax=Peteryoungia desertarenae TaxID=1813451 RepID=A0ABX6QK53_9HYPH|nr:isopentenyl-diphosphate delta-isomerase [Peteryoungia desertarenae]QLF68485.1 isopentenyl-diphosphate delta-isomerase [Peteryoungia desertarenae]
MNQPIVIPAVARDGSLYPIEKMKAHVDGVLHLAVSVFVFDGDLLLIQKRASGKYHCGGQWANTCCSHPHWSESVEDCAERRLSEELGFAVPLTRHETVEYAADVGSGLKENERVTLFSAQVDRRRLDVVPNPEEVEAVQWVAPRNLYRAVAETPDAFTPWFRIYLERFPALQFAA